MVLGDSVTVSSWALYTAAGLLAVYGVCLIFYDRTLSARPSRNLLVQTLNGLRNCADWRERSEPDFSEFSGCTEVNDAIYEAQRVLQTDRLRKRAKDNPSSPWQYGLWIDTSNVSAEWREAHRIERLCWRRAASLTEVEARMRSARSQLLSIPGLEAAALATRIADYDNAPTSAAQTLPWGLRRWIITKLSLLAPETREEPRALLNDALVFLHDHRDTTYESLADRQTKGTWFAVLAITVILVAAFTFHRESLLLFGAIGGLLSRILRLLRRPPGTMDYGVSSATFVLAPIVGALSGWAGVALVQGLATANVLNAKTFSHVWDQPNRPLALTIAFAFGFVERLLDRFAGAAAAAISPPTKPSTPPATRPGMGVPAPADPSDAPPVDLSNEGTDAAPPRDDAPQDAN